VSRKSSHKTPWREKRLLRKRKIALHQTLAHRFDAIAQFHNELARCILGYGSELVLKYLRASNMFRNGGECLGTGST